MYIVTVVLRLFEHERSVNTSSFVGLFVLSTNNFNISKMSPYTNLILKACSIKVIFLKYFGFIIFTHSTFYNQTNHKLHFKTRSLNISRLIFYCNIAAAENSHQIYLIHKHPANIFPLCRPWGLENTPRT